VNPQNGFKPHVIRLGHGPRRVLALHCTLAFGGAWAGLAKLIGEDSTLIAPDMPSHGKSADWDEVSDFSDTVLQASFAAMEDAPMDVIGHSFGAATALRMAALHPERLRPIMITAPRRLTRR
jgi:lipase